MTQYFVHGVTISDGQNNKIKNAIKNGTEVSIKLSNSDLIGEHKLLLTKSQTTKINKAIDKGTGVTIKLSKTQVKKNTQYEGGFLSALAGLAASVLPVIARTVLPALATGALSGLTNSLTQKAVGKGLYLKKGGCVCQIETDGSGLYLAPANSKSLAKYGDGLYLKQGGEMYDGRGLLLGPNSPFKSIPILGMIL